jgi:hypothetical protein
MADDVVRAFNPVQWTAFVSFLPTGFACPFALGLPFAFGGSVGIMLVGGRRLAAVAAVLFQTGHLGFKVLHLIVKYIDQVGNRPGVCLGKPLQCVPGWPLDLHPHIKSNLLDLGQLKVGKVYLQCITGCFLALHLPLLEGT